MTIKILFVQYNAGICGAPLSLLTMLSTLNRKRYHPTVLFTGSDGPVRALYRERGFEVIAQEGIGVYGHTTPGRPKFGGFPPWRPISLLFRIYPSAHRMASFLEQHKFDLVYLNSAILLPAALGCRMQGVPTIMHVREMLYRGRFGYRRRIFRDLIENSVDHLIVLSYASKRQFSGRIPVDVVYNSVDFKEFDRNISQQSARQTLSLPQDGLLVIMLGSVVPHKGADVFVKAADLVKKTWPNAYFAVVGITSPFVSLENTFPKRFLKRLLLPDPGREFQSLIASLELHNRLILPGIRTDIPIWLAAADLCVFPAREDHFSRPVIEAGAMGIPAIASDGNTARELIDDGEQGYLVPPGDHVALARIICNLLADPAKRAIMGDKGYERARDRYDVLKNTPLIQDVIDKVSETSYRSESN